MRMCRIMAGHLLQVMVSAVSSPAHDHIAHSCTLLLRLLPSRLAPPLYRDNLVAQGKESKVSAAVVFLPQDTLHYGKCGSDKCYCVEVSSTRRCSYIA
jgi:hypothetical protein